ncbi:MAG: PhoH family protein [Candidatus Absconditabacterales bacterium]|nr:PhoH family protein [Candidatus Absconditabacterales bacterium]
MSKTKKNKIFVLDTSVLLVDPASFSKFLFHDVIIPLDVVAELDKAKKYTDTVGFNARETTRLLDSYFSPELFNNGISMGKGKGNLSIYFLRELNPDVKRVLKEDKVDHRIISVALNLKTKKNQDKDVVLVSNDTNLRFKAASFGLEVQSYKNDRVEDLDNLYKGILKIEDVELDPFIDELYKKKEILLEELEIISKNSLKPNQYLILTTSTEKTDIPKKSVLPEKSALCRINEDKTMIILVSKESIYGKVFPRNAEQTLSVNALLDKNLSLITLNGPAGTGKTLIAIGTAISQASHYDQIFIARPIVAMSNKDLGYLPGDIQAKIAPYMQPLLDNIRFLKQSNGGDEKKKSSKIDNLMESGKLIIEPLAYIRGRTLPNTLFIIDEAQNLTPSEIKTIVTRMGENSKVIFTGDIYQIDHPYLDSYSNGLSYLIEKAKDYEKAAHVSLEKGERSELSDWAAKNL